MRSAKMGEFKTKHYVASLCLALSLFVGSLNASGCCTDGETEVDPDDCTQYRVCCHGEFVSKSCDLGYYWNSDFKDCVRDNGECNPPKCVDGEIEENPDDCAGYLECINGTVVIQSCPEGYYFSVTKCIPDTCGVCVNCTEGSKKADLDDCTKYQLCSGGKYVTVSCDDGEFWNNKTQRCQVDNGECNGTPSCTDGTVKVDPTDCAGYLACSNGSFVSKKCAEGAYFNNKSLTCIPDTDGVCLNCTEGSKRPDPSGDCTKYQLCSGGKYVTVSCEDGEFWNNKTQRCQVDNGECNGTPSCTDGTVKVDPTDCAGYLACSNGSFVSKKCAEGAYFNNKSLTCIPDTDGVCLNCTEGSKRPDPFGDCTKYQLCSGGKYVTVSCEDGEFWNNKTQRCQVDNGECNGTPSCTDGTVKVDPTDCAGYLACSNGSFVSKKCAEGAYFNNKSLTCIPDTDGVCLNCTEGSKRPDPSGDCTKYQLCSGGKYVTVSCEDGEFWNNKTQRCQVDNGECNGTPSCTDGTVKVDPTDCAGYLACSNGSFVSKKCAEGAYFNNKSLTCIPDTDGVCLNCTEGSKRPDPFGDCTKYQLCSGGKYVTVSCEDGEFWNNKTQRCQVDNGECNGTPSCTDGTVKVDPTDCAGYLSCSNGSFVNIKCAEGAYFNNKSLTCIPDTEGVCLNCTEGSKQPDPSGDCTKYQLCSGGKYVTVSCEDGEFWNNKTQVCQVDNGECNGTPSCTEGFIKANPADCAGYLQCVNGNYVARKCSATEFFNTTLQQCVVDKEGVCIPKTCDPQCCDLPNSSIWPVDKNCSAFFFCVDGKYIQQRCPDNLQFNPKTEKCDYPENVDCEDGSAPPSGPGAGPSGTYCESHGRCVGQRDGTMFGDAGKTCSSSYVVCQCECEVDFSCSAGLVFDVNGRTCNWPSNVNC